MQDQDRGHPAPEESEPFIHIITNYCASIAPSYPQWELEVLAYSPPILLALNMMILNESSQVQVYEDYTDDGESDVEKLSEKIRITIDAHLRILQ